MKIILDKMDLKQAVVDYIQGCFGLWIDPPDVTFWSDEKYNFPLFAEILYEESDGEKEHEVR